METKPSAVPTVSKACQILSKILDRAIKSGHISSNPCMHVRRPMPARRSLPIITEFEIARLAAEIDVRFRPMVYLGCYSGLRAGELLGLRWRNIDLTGRRLNVVQTVVETNGQLLVDQPPKSDAGRRIVPLSREVTRALLHHAELFGSRPDDYVFPNETGNAMRLSNFRNRYWKPALKKAGLESFRIHDTRHTAISLWIKAEINVKDVSVHAGHTSVAFTLDRYGHLYPDNGDAFLRALDAATDQSLRISGHDSGHGIAPVIGINSLTSENEWTLWDGFQTLPKLSNVSLTRENVILSHPHGRPPRARNAPPRHPKRAIWKKRDSFQTLCSGGSLKVSSMTSRTSTRRGPRSMHSDSDTASTGPRSSPTSIGEGCPDASSPGK